jgi:hypothetical protein
MQNQWLRSEIFRFRALECRRLAELSPDHLQAEYRRLAEAYEVLADGMDQGRSVVDAASCRGLGRGESN